MTTHPLAPFTDDPRFPPKIRERLKTVHVLAQRNADTAADSAGVELLETFNRRLRALVTSSAPTWIRLQELYSLADDYAVHIAPRATCRRGCSHCCNVGVRLFEQEAQMLAQRIGVKAKTTKLRDTWREFDYGYHRPCTFLVNGECSIYEHRPFACRALYNMDEDSLLCELHPPLSIPVPYFNLSLLWRAYLTICAPHKSNDIRTYFPQGRRP